MPALEEAEGLYAWEGGDLVWHEHPMQWHPMIYHYGRNWTLPADGTYTTVDVEFSQVQVSRVQD